MTILKRSIRPANASYKNSAREIERRFKEVTKHYQQKLDQQVTRENDAAIITYNEYIDMLCSVHEEYNELLDWDSFMNERKPIAPVFWPIWENEAQFNLRKYEPTFLEVVTGQDRRKIRSLRQKLVEARAEDIDVHLFNQKNYFKNKGDWDLLQVIKSGVENGDPEAYKAAIDFFDPYAKITRLGSSLAYNIHSNHLRMDVYINGAAIIPGYSFTQTASGDVISTPLPPERFNHIFHDHVCSCALLLVRQTFALLPVQYVSVNVMQNALKTSGDDTGNRAILSVKFDPDIMKQENEQVLKYLKVSINSPGKVPFSIINKLPAQTKIKNEGNLASST